MTNANALGYKAEPQVARSLLLGPLRVKRRESSHCLARVANNGTKLPRWGGCHITVPTRPIHPYVVSLRNLTDAHGLAVTHSVNEGGGAGSAMSCWYQVVG